MCCVVGGGVGGFKFTHHKLFMSLNKWNLDFQEHFNLSGYASIRFWSVLLFESFPT